MSNTQSPRLSVQWIHAARLHIFMSVLTHSDQVFLGLPLLLGLGIVILVMEFMHEEERAACPYHLKRLVWRAAVTLIMENYGKIMDLCF